ncbi:MAG: FHA domain-containing protein, partial [Acidobacteria bacterium]|nr:FHA domain-containing protein [Acidobacteriota bacterium]
ASAEPSIIGRTSDQIQLSDNGASRRHAELRFENGVWMLSDLNSSNGTYVNGVWADSAVLDADDELIIGKFHLIVARGDI